MKIKTKKIVAKRFKITKTGKVLRRKQGLRHLKSSKGKNQKRRLEQIVSVDSGFKKNIKRFLPYA